MESFTTTVTLFANKFNITVYVDSLYTISNLNIGSKAKSAITQELRRLTGKSVNVSSFKNHIELINKKLEESGLTVDVYINVNHKNKKLLTAVFAGKQIQREKKLEELMS